MFKIDDKNGIHITRGDIGSIQVSAETSTNTPYTFAVGDVVRLQVMKSKDCTCVILKKQVTVAEACTSVTISLSSTDTTIGDVISKPCVYWYEIELNPTTNPQTIIGYDENGAKEFTLYPEGVGASA